MESLDKIYQKYSRKVYLFLLGKREMKILRKN